MQVLASRQEHFYFVIYFVFNILLYMSFFAQYTYDHVMSQVLASHQEQIHM
jgi:hypothetical protein